MYVIWNHKCVRCIKCDFNNYFLKKNILLELSTEYSETSKAMMYGR